MADSVQLLEKPKFVNIMSYTDYILQSDATILNQLRYQHLLVVDGPKPSYGFDKTGLCRLATLSKNITIHGWIIFYFS